MSQNNSAVDIAHARTSPVRNTRGASGGVVQGSQMNCGTAVIPGLLPAEPAKSADRLNSGVGDAYSSRTPKTRSKLSDQFLPRLSALKGNTNRRPGNESYVDV